MKTKTTITELTHEDLVNLLCTATYGSYWLEIYAPDRKGIIVDERDCREDVWAKALLAGNKIVCTDYNADEGEYYGHLDHEDDGDGHTSYLVSLQDIKDGLAKCADGTFKVAQSNYNNYGESDKKWLSECLKDFIKDDGSMDNPEAEALMQIILFDELIYG